MIKLPLLAIVFVLAPAMAPAQSQPPAPIERRAPVSHPPHTVLEWPRPGDVKPHTRLLISTFDTIHPQICKLLGVDEYHIVCAADRNGPDAAYDRALVENIQIAPHGYTALSLTKKAAFEGGGGMLGLSFLCGVDGGALCKGPAIAGLSLLAGGIVLHIAQVHARNKEPKLIYISAARPVMRRWPPLPSPLSNE